MSVTTSSALGGAQRYKANVGDFFQTLPPLFAQIFGADIEDMAWMELEAKAEAITDQDQLRALLSEKGQIRMQTAALYGRLGAPVITAIGQDAMKWERSGRPEVGFCPRPAALGGCSVPLATDELTRDIASQTKARRALAKAEKTEIEAPEG